MCIGINCIWRNSKSPMGTIFFPVFYENRDANIVALMALSNIYHNDIYSLNGAILLIINRHGREGSKKYQTFIHGQNQPTTL